MTEIKQKLHKRVDRELTKEELKFIKKYGNPAKKLKKIIDEQEFDENFQKDAEKALEYLENT